MKSKEYLILTVVIVALLAYLFLRSNNRTEYQLPTLTKITTQNVTRMEITHAGNTVLLTKSGDRWQIGKQHYPADKTKVSDMLSVLAGLKLTALVSEAKAYEPYGLTDQKKIHVKAWAGDRLVRDMYIGKEADTYRHTFVRIGNNPDVYHAENDFSRTFNETVASLRDKTALSFNSSDITHIDIDYAGKHRTLVLKKQPATKTPAEKNKKATQSKTTASPVWQMADGKPVDSNAAKHLVSQFAYLTCKGYLEGRKKADFKDPALTISMKGGKTYTLSVYKKEGTEKAPVYPAVSSQNDYPFTLSQSAYTRMIGILENLFGTQKASTQKAS